MHVVHAVHTVHAAHAVHAVHAVICMHAAMSCLQALHVMLMNQDVGRLLQAGMHHYLVHFAGITVYCACPHHDQSGRCT